MPKCPNRCLHCRRTPYCRQLRRLQTAGTRLLRRTDRALSLCCAFYSSGCAASGSSAEPRRSRSAAAPDGTPDAAPASGTACAALLPAAARSAVPVQAVPPAAAASAARSAESVRAAPPAAAASAARSAEPVQAARSAVRCSGFRRPAVRYSDRCCSAVFCCSC